MPSVLSVAHQPKPETQNPVEPDPEVAGWLVVHDEKTPLQTFNLKMGKQLIGRKSESRPCDIMINSQDEYMSRNHFFIEVKTSINHGMIYILIDNGSTNYTFINTATLAMLKQNDQYILKDGDVIQAGETKIVFKSRTETVSNATEATRLVTTKAKGHTVLISHAKVQS